MLKTVETLEVIGIATAISFAGFFGYSVFFINSDMCLSEVVQTVEGPRKVELIKRTCAGLSEGSTEVRISNGLSSKAVFTLEGLWADDMNISWRSENVLRIEYPETALTEEEIVKETEHGKIQIEYVSS